MDYYSVACAAGGSASMAFIPSSGNVHVHVSHVSECERDTSDSAHDTFRDDVMQDRRTRDVRAVQRHSLA